MNHSHWLFYTAGNGDILSCPHNPKLYKNTKSSRRAFLGDAQADNFQVIASGELPLFPKWDGSKYVVDSAAQAERIKEETDEEEKNTLLKDLVKVIKNLRARVKALEDK